MSLKNYTTTISVDKTINEIQKILSTHKAKAILTEYDEFGKISALSFKIETIHGEVGIKLPAKQENVLKILQIQKRKNSKIKANKEQAEKTAWRNIKDWIDAQMALVDTEMVEIDEVFLPYILNKNGTTLYESFINNQLLLGEGENYAK